MPKNALAPQPSNALVDFYRQNVSPRVRTYGESLLKSFTGRTDSPITEADYSPDELAALQQLVKEHHSKKLAQFNRPKAELLQNAIELEKAAADELDYAKNGARSESSRDSALGQARHFTTQAKQLREAMEGKIPSDFAFGYRDYGPRQGVNKYENDPQGWGQTLGRFRYKVDPKTGEYNIYDTYDFNNDVHRYRAEEYAKMSAPSRMANALADTFISGNQYALGEAYLAGPNSVPVKIKGKLK
jgi:hypothetical protein